MNRTERYMEKIHTMCAGLDTDEDIEQLLRKLKEGWERRYRDFIITEGESEPVDNPYDPPQAADYLATITALGAELARMEVGE